MKDEGSIFIEVMGLLFIVVLCIAAILGAIWLVTSVIELKGDDGSLKAEVVSLRQDVECLQGGLRTVHSLTLGAALAYSELKEGIQCVSNVAERFSLYDEGGATGWVNCVSNVMSNDYIAYGVTTQSFSSLRTPIEYKVYLSGGE